MGEVEEKKLKIDSGCCDGMKKFIGYLVAIALSGFLFWNIIQNWGVISTTSWNLESIDSLFLLASLFLIYFSNIISWHLVTKALGTNVKLKENSKLWMVSNLSRLLPGSIWQYPSRVYLLSQYGVSKTIGVTAVILESALNLGVGAAVVFLSLAFWRLPVGLANLKILLLVFLFFVFSILLLMNKKVVVSLLRMIKNLTGKEVNIISRANIPAKWILPFVMSFFLKFVFIGMALFFLIRLSLPFDFSALPGVIGIFALSWLLGYITVFAPAGLGVQEISIATMLSFYMPFPIASMIAISFRVVLLLTEATAILFVSTNFKQQKNLLTGLK